MQIKAVAEDQVDQMANMTSGKHIEFDFCLYDAEIQATAWSIPNNDSVTGCLQYEIQGITSNVQKLLNKKLTIWLIEFEALQEDIGIQMVQKAIEYHIMVFPYSMMILGSLISEPIWQMGFSVKLNTSIYEYIQIGKVNEGYQATNNDIYNRQTLKHNNWSTSLEYAEKPLLNVAHQGWYKIDYAKVSNLLSTTDTWQNPRRAHL